MDHKKISSQDAFDQVLRGQGKKRKESQKSKNIEDGFGGKAEQTVVGRPVWQRYLLRSSIVVIALALIVAVGAFYWFVTKHSEPEVVEKAPVEAPPAVIGKEQAKEIIEGNLRAFLQAESNKERLKYIYISEDEIASLENYYGQRQHLETPLWKIERMEKLVSEQGEIWFIVYRDVKKHQHLVSFQRQGDGYLLHWLAMKVYCEIPWEEFIIQKPADPVVMRCYLREYNGVWPVGISPEDFHVFLVSDSKETFLELVIMRHTAEGFEALLGLPNLPSLSVSKGHPVTLELRYTRLGNVQKKQLEIKALKYLRWQRLNTDSHVPGR